MMTYSCIGPGSGPTADPRAPDRWVVAAGPNLPETTRQAAAMRVPQSPPVPADLGHYRLRPIIQREATKMPDDPCALSIAAAARLLRSRKLSPVELTEAYL